MAKISIIIPVYNVEKYIRACLDSILNQTFQDFEVILVDDGTPDNSGAICDEYAAADSRFKVFHKKNGGVSSARNLGIEKASGEWITFVDADDTISQNCLDICYQHIIENNIDLLQFNFTREKNSYNEEYIRCNNIMNHISFLDKPHKVCIAGNVIKRDVITRNNIRFREGMKLAEDQSFVLHVIKNSSAIISIPNKLYYYRPNNESATHTAKISDIIKSSEILLSEKIKHPEFTHQIDNTIIGFMIEAIVSGNDGINKMKHIYKSANIKHHDRTHRTGKIFYHISKISVDLAISLYSTYLHIIKNKK